MARTEMTALIGRVRDLIQDPAGTDQVFDDDQIEAVLDVWRLEVRQEELSPVATRSAAGDQYLFFRSDYGDFEAGVTLEDAGYVAIDSADFTADDVAGTWSFDAEPNYPIYISGHAYDPYGAAADLMDRKVANGADLYDWSADGGSYKQSQIYSQLTEFAEYLRRRQKGYGFHFNGVAVMVRTDVPEFYS